MAFLNFSEFIQGVSQFSVKGDKLSKLKFAFRIYDMDNDGFISNGELFQVCIFLAIVHYCRYKDQFYRNIYMHSIHKVIHKFINKNYQKKSLYHTKRFSLITIFECWLIFWNLQFLLQILKEYVLLCINKKNRRY